MFADDTLTLEILFDDEVTAKSDSNTLFYVLMLLKKEMMVRQNLFLNLLFKPSVSEG